jgi:hypothetical protein
MENDPTKKLALTLLMSKIFLMNDINQVESLKV